MWAALHHGLCSLYSSSELPDCPRCRSCGRWYGANVASPLEDPGYKLWWFPHFSTSSTSVQNAKALGDGCFHLDSKWCLEVAGSQSHSGRAINTRLYLTKAKPRQRTVAEVELLQRPSTKMMPCGARGMGGQGCPWEPVGLEGSTSSQRRYCLNLKF